MKPHFIWSWELNGWVNRDRPDIWRFRHAGPSGFGARGWYFNLIPHPIWRRISGV